MMQDFLAGAIMCAMMVLTTSTNAKTLSDQDSTMKTVTAGKFTFCYKIDGPNLVAMVSYPTTGWVSVGFNPVKAMKGACIIMGAVEQGKALVSEQFGTGLFSHKSVTELGGKNVLVASDCVVKDAVATLSFTLPLNSGDSKHVKIVPGDETTIIFAAGKTSDMSKKHMDKKKITVTF
jgi:hypothetical protein